jgi:hypothetical protein
MSEEALRALRRGNVQGALDALIQEVAELSEVSANAPHAIDYYRGFLPSAYGSAGFVANDASIATGVVPAVLGNRSMLITALVARDHVSTDAETVVCGHGDFDGLTGWELADLGTAAADPAVPTYVFSIVGDGLDPLFTASLPIPSADASIQKWHLIQIWVNINNTGTISCTGYINGIEVLPNQVQANFGDVVPNTTGFFTIGGVENDGAIERSYYAGRVAAVAFTTTFAGYQLEAEGAAWVYDQVKRTGDLPTYYTNPDFLLESVLEDAKYQYVWSAKRTSSTGTAGTTWASAGTATSATLTNIGAGDLEKSDDPNPQWI